MAQNISLVTLQCKCTCQPSYVYADLHNLDSLCYSHEDIPFCFGRYPCSYLFFVFTLKLMDMILTNNWKAWFCRGNIKERVGYVLGQADNIGTAWKNMTAMQCEWIRRVASYMGRCARTSRGEINQSAGSQRWRTPSYRVNCPRVVLVSSRLTEMSWLPQDEWFSQFLGEFLEQKWFQNFNYNFDFAKAESSF